MIRYVDVEKNVRATGGGGTGGHVDTFILSFMRRKGNANRRQPIIALLRWEIEPFMQATVIRCYIINDEDHASRSEIVARKPVSKPELLPSTKAVLGVPGLLPREVL